jgi:hypothetical protein
MDIYGYQKFSFDGEGNVKSARGCLDLNLHCSDFAQQNFFNHDFLRAITPNCALWRHVGRNDRQYRQYGL